jgi:hypothetical protein
MIGNAFAPMIVAVLYRHIARALLRADGYAADDQAMLGEPPRLGEWYVDTQTLRPVMPLSVVDLDGGGGPPAIEWRALMPRIKVYQQQRWVGRAERAVFPDKALVGARAEVMVLDGEADDVGEVVVVVEDVDEVVVISDDEVEEVEAPAEVAVEVPSAWVQTTDTFSAAAATFNPYGAVDMDTLASTVFQCPTTFAPRASGCCAATGISLAAAAAAASAGTAMFAAPPLGIDATPGGGFGYAGGRAAGDRMVIDLTLD